MKSRLATTILFCLVFLCGVFAGLLAERLLADHSMLAFNFAAQTRPHVIDTIKSDLNLTDEQTHQVESILDDASRQFNNLHEQAQTVRLQAKERIRSILNDQQRQKLDASMNKIQKIIAEEK